MSSSRGGKVRTFCYFFVARRSDRAKVARETRSELSSTLAELLFRLATTSLAETTCKQLQRNHLRAMPLSSDEGDDADFQSHFRNESSSSSSPSPPPPQHNFFAPPFYNRPPTPLPPSPSLTSLLRPSRPNTPDSSADEIEPVPRASPKVPTYEYYGFVLYLFSSLTFLMYLLWSYLPSPFLHALGIYYYPNRWWSLALPSFLVMLLVYIYVALASYNTGHLTLPLSNIETIIDDAANVATIDSKGRMGKSKTGRKRTGKVENTVQDWTTTWSQGTDAVMDVPLGGVCEVLYGADREMEDEEGPS